MSRPFLNVIVEAEEDQQGPAIELLSETLYFLFVFILTNIEHALCYDHRADDNTRLISTFILCECYETFDGVANHILKRFSQWLLTPMLCKLQSPFLVYEQISCVRLRIS